MSEPVAHCDKQLVALVVHLSSRRNVGVRRILTLNRIIAHERIDIAFGLAVSISKVEVPFAVAVSESCRYTVGSVSFGVIVSRTVV